jgi:hypothetical protein
MRFRGGTGYQYTLTRRREALHNLSNLLRSLALTEHDFGKAAAHGPMMVELSKAEIFEREGGQPLDRGRLADFAGSHLAKEGPDLITVYWSISEHRLYQRVNFNLPGHLTRVSLVVYGTVPGGLMTRPFSLLAILILAALLIPTTVAAGPTRASAPTGHFGAIEAFRAGKEASDAGLTWQRISFLWSGLQPSGPGDWNQFYFPDSDINAEIESGRKIVGLIMGPPAWANGTGSHSDPPNNFALAPDDPNNNWAAYVAKLVSTYKGRIDNWIIWNEPDIWDSTFPIFAWNGSVTDYYRLVKRAYIAGKAANPDATIALGGQTYWWDKKYDRELFFKRFLDVGLGDETAKANGFYFDALVLHLYNDPSSLYDVPVYYKQLMAAYGIDKPVWINETNVVPYNDAQSPLPRSDYRVSLDEQASYIIQAGANALAAGVQRLGFYKMRDDDGYGPGSEPYGLIRADGTPKPEFQAVKTLTHYLDNAGPATRSIEGTVMKVTFNGAANKTTVLWNMSSGPAIYPLPASSASATLVDKKGQERKIGPSGGVYSIELAPATANTVPGEPLTYLVGGSPMIVVEPTARTESRNPVAAALQVGFSTER